MLTTLIIVYIIMTFMVWIMTGTERPSGDNYLSLLIVVICIPGMLVVSVLKKIFKAIWYSKDTTRYLSNQTTVFMIWLSNKLNKDWSSRVVAYLYYLKSLRALKKANDHILSEAVEKFVKYNQSPLLKHKWNETTMEHILKHVKAYIEKRGVKSSNG